MAYAWASDLPIPHVSIHDAVLLFRSILQYHAYTGNHQAIVKARQVLAAAVRRSHARRYPMRRVPRWRLPARYLADITCPPYGL